jgi:catechol 2,3-dioxygenase-like lactoylglutathione lyase family enzyme
MITQVKIACITVTDQDKALTFYTEKLGFKTVTDAPMGDKGRWLELETPEGSTRLALLLPQHEGEKAGGFSNILFTSNDVRKTYDELKARGVEFTEPPKEEFWGTYVIFADPDGNQFLIGS